ncbi:hypothetical protein [Streptomyces aidingensis]|uniref:hypothetical protein n=1 Tax=Streptomyces aidingensis TaxID=910347 RepID=UPI000A855E96
MTSTPHDGRPGSGRDLPALLTCAMAFSMLQLFLLGALGPRQVDRLGVTPTVLGLTTTVGFGTAALLSPAGGRLVDRIGPCRALAALLLASAAAPALIALAPGPGFAPAAVALGGVPQALRPADEAPAPSLMTCWMCWPGTGAPWCCWTTSPPRPRRPRSGPTPPPMCWRCRPWSG